MGKIETQSYMKTTQESKQNRRKKKIAVEMVFYFSLFAVVMMA